MADDIPKKTTYSVIAYPSKTLPEEIKRNMILNNFLRSLERENGYFKLIHKKSFYDFYPQYVKSIIERPEVTARLCVLTDEPDVILGWSLIQKNILHYVFVKGNYRGQGIGTSLVPVKIDWFTHITKAGLNIWHNKAPHANLNPFL